MGFWLHMVITPIYLFPVALMLAEFAIQHITWCDEVIPKMVSIVFWVLVVCLFVFSTLPAWPGALSCLNCPGEGQECLQSDAWVLPCISELPGKFSPDKHSPFSLKLNGQLIDIPCSTVDPVFIGRVPSPSQWSRKSRGLHTNHHWYKHPARRLSSCQSPAFLLAYSQSLGASLIQIRKISVQIWALQVFICLFDCLFAGVPFDPGWWRECLNRG